jgi:hypothetical protein
MNFQFQFMGLYVDYHYSSATEFLFEVNLCNWRNFLNCSKRFNEVKALHNFFLVKMNSQCVDFVSYLMGFVVTGSGRSEKLISYFKKYVRNPVHQIILMFLLQEAFDSFPSDYCFASPLPIHTVITYDRLSNLKFCDKICNVVLGNQCVDKLFFIV